MTSGILTPLRTISTLYPGDSVISVESRFSILANCAKDAVMVMSTYFEDFAVAFGCGILFGMAMVISFIQNELFSLFS